MAGRPWTLVESDLAPARREFALALRTLHRRAGDPSLAELAHQTRLAASTISRYLAGKTLPSRDSLHELINALSTDTAGVEEMQRLWEHAVAESGPGPSKPWAGSLARSGGQLRSEEATEARDLFAALKQDSGLSMREIAARLEAKGHPVARTSVSRVLQNPAASALPLALVVSEVLIEQFPDSRRDVLRETVHRLLTDARGAEHGDVRPPTDHMAAEADVDRLRRSDDAARNVDAPASGSAARRLILGSQLRRLREARGITREAAGYSIRASDSRILRIELGRVKINPRDVEDLLTLYGITDEDDRATFITLAREANTPDWWHNYADAMPFWFQTYISLEGAASLICAYETHWVHALLQTESYAAAVTKQGMKNATPEEVERRVALRLERQKYLIAENAPDFHVVLDEAVLRRTPGNREVMRNQLQHLIDVSERSNVQLQIMPFSLGATSATAGAFTILSFPERELADVVYMENLTGALYLDREEEVSHYKEAMKELQSECPSPAESRALLRGILRL